MAHAHTRTYLSSSMTMRVTRPQPPRSVLGIDIGKQRKGCLAIERRHCRRHQLRRYKAVVAAAAHLENRKPNSSEVTTNVESRRGNIETPKIAKWNWQRNRIAQLRSSGGKGDRECQESNGRTRPRLKNRFVSLRIELVDEIGSLSASSQTLQTRARIKKDSERME